MNVSLEAEGPQTNREKERCRCLFGQGHARGVIHKCPTGKVEGKKSVATFDSDRKAKT
jgi:hypothetical protein